jgi:hypothetical protein
VVGGAERFVLVKSARRKWTRRASETDKAPGLIVRRDR